MASIVISGDTSGAVTIEAPAIAGSPTLTLPTTTGTLVVTGGAQTVQFAAGTVSAPSITFTGDTNTGIYSPAADTIAFTEGGVESMRIDSSGNVGIGATPSAWSAYKGLNIGLNTTLAGSTGGSVGLLSTNAYFDGSSYKYITTDAATQYQQNTGQHIWRGAASGTAGNTLTFTQILALERTKSLALEGASSQSGTGITFPATQSASSDANTLDDYEEGTWTPVAARYTGGNITATYSAGNTGKYTKIGRVVILECYLDISSVSSQGSSLAQIAGLPFPPAGSYASTGATFLNSAATTLNIVSCATHGGDNVFYFHESGNGGALAVFDWKAGSMTFTVSYVT